MNRAKEKDSKCFFCLFVKIIILESSNDNESIINFDFIRKNVLIIIIMIIENNYKSQQQQRQHSKFRYESENDHFIDDYHFRKCPVEPKMTTTNLNCFHFCN